MRKLDEYQKFLAACIIGSCVWIVAGLNACYSFLDEIIYVAVGMSFPVGALLVKKLRLIEN
jgi:hypothetical protein